MDHLKIMKTAEIVAVLAVVFLATLSLGDGAPQWRPQGRFGKRMDTRNGLLTALRSVSDETEQLEPLFVDNGEISEGMDAFNTETSRGSSVPRVCIETSFPGVFRCHRRKRFANQGLDEDE